VGGQDEFVAFFLFLADLHEPDGGVLPVE